MPLTLRRDCRFSFTDIDDVIVFIKFGLNHDLRWHDYNFVPSKSYLLSEIAEEIRAIANLRQDVIIETPGLNREYTGSNLRLLSEFNKFTPLRESLKKVFDEMLLISENVDVTDIDGRWKNK